MKTLRDTFSLTHTTVKRFAKKLWRRFRIVEFKLKRRHTWLPRLRWLALAGLVLFSACVPTLEFLIKNQGYYVSDTVRSIVGTPNKALASKIAYNAEKDSWQFNKDGMPLSSSTSQQASMPTVEDLKAQIGGGSKKDNSLYSVDIPSDGRKGLTYYDTNTDLSFNLAPEFYVGQARKTDDYIVYSAQKDVQLIYTAKTNGMKEDIILNKPIGDEVEFNYTLNLPSDLKATIQDDGSLGIFSASPALYGNISFGDGQDKEKIMSARQTAAKDHLLFVIPAPVIVEAGGNTTKSHTRFTLRDGMLSIVAQNMQALAYPLSVDPSVVVTSSTDFGAGNGDNISYDTDQISRDKLTGGSLGTWGTTTSYSVGGVAGVGAVAYNGYLYATGGNNGSTQEDDSQYAAINSDGTVGTWTAGGDMTIPRTLHGSVAYNGYLYAIGGTTTSGTKVNSVEYAPINSNGSIGTWATTSSLSSVTTSASAVAYNGYLYLLGGGDGSATNTVAYAAIKADGSLGSWSTTTSFTTARYGANTFAYNNRMYVMGGYNGSSTYYNDVQSAPINSDGSLGSWSTTTSFTTARTGAFGGVYGGYAYIAGGTATDHSTGDAFGDTQYAQINADGSLGAWRASTTMSLERYSGGFATYKGRLYAVGGIESGVGTRSVQYATINPAGTTTAYTTSGNTFTTTRRGAQTIAYGNYLYVMGGDNGGTPVNTVYKAAIASNGTIGTFSSTTAFTTNRTYFAAVAYNGYMYAIGGCSSAYSSCTTAANNVATIYRSPINNTNGTLGTWINTNNTNLPTARYGISAVVYNNYLYVMGGLNGSTFSNTVYYHAIDPGGSTSDGRLSGAWSTATSNLPASMAYTQATVYGGKLYVAGGCTAGDLTCTTSRADVHYTGFNTSGDLSGAFSSTASFTTARGDFGLTAVNGYLYLTGGRTNTSYYDDTQYAIINSDGTAGTWTSLSNSTLATARYGIGMVATTGNLYVTGGYNGTTYYNNVQLASVNNGGSGAITGWVEDTVDHLGTVHNKAQTVAYNGYLYTMGGIGASNNNLNSVEYAPLNTDGTVGVWSTTSSFTNGRNIFASAAMNGYMYILGGITYGSGAYYKDIQYATINSDGTLGTWASAGGNVSNGGQGVCMATWNGYIYSLGGWDGSTDHNSVQYAAQNTNGTIGAWQNANSFTGARSNSQCVAYNGYLYLIGGEDTTGKNDVQYAAINGNGSLGTWQYTTSYHLGRANHAAIAYGGYMYVIGGVNSTTTNTPRPDAQYAAINPNGTLGPWQHTSAFSEYEYMDVALYNGFIYLPGQYSITNRTTTQYAPLNMIARKGQYSKLLDLGGDSKVSSISYNGTLPGGTKQINYRLAGADGVFGSLSNVSSPGTSGPCTGAFGGGRYIWLSVALDDTYVASFPDSVGSSATITDMTVSYDFARPAPNVRLHGGKSLVNGTLNPLDACIGS